MTLERDCDNGQHDKVTMFRMFVALMLAMLVRR